MFDNVKAMISRQLGIADNQPFDNEDAGHFSSLLDKAKSSVDDGFNDAETNVSNLVQMPSDFLHKGTTLTHNVLSDASHPVSTLESAFDKVERGLGASAHDGSMSSAFADVEKGLIGSANDGDSIDSALANVERGLNTGQ